MKLTKNEKQTLKFLLEDARIPDSIIASTLRISSQAIGKIRKKLEKTLIESYTLNLNYSKLGIQTFAIALAKLTPEGLDKGELEVEKKLLDDPHIIQVYRLPNGNITHFIFFGFRDINELDNCFHSPQKIKELHKFIEVKELFTFSYHSIIKNSPVNLFKKAIDEASVLNSRINLEELENYKKKLKNN